MANEIQVSTSFPALREINKSLKVVDKLLLSSKKLEWNNLHVSMKYYIFNELLGSELLKLSYYPPAEIDCFFNEFILNEDKILFRYTNLLSEREFGGIADNSFIYGHDIIIENEVLLNKFCDYFGLSICVENGEYVVSNNWDCIEFDFSVITTNNIIGDLSICFGFIKYENIRNIELIRKLEFGSVELLSTRLLSKYQLEELFSKILNKNLYEVKLKGANQRDYEIHSKFFPFLRTLSICGNDNIHNYKFLLNYSRLNAISAYFESPDDDFRNFIKNISLLRKIKSLCINAYWDFRKPREMFFQDILFLSNLNDIEYLSLSNCSDLLDIDILYRMNNLKFLNLSVLGEVKYVKSQLDKLQEYRPELKIYLTPIKL